jgi:putative DNA primase/helicase
MSVNNENAAKAAAALWKNGEAGAAEKTGVELLDFASIESKAIRWLWPGWLARGKFHVIAGAPGTGKTTIALSIAAAISAGTPFPDGHKTAPGKVFIWSGEDDPADTLKPRLIAAGADINKLGYVGPVTEYDPERKANCTFPFDPARDVPALEAKLAHLDDVALIVIDPIVAAVSGDSNKNAEVRRGLMPLIKLAEAKNAALLGVSHYSKGTQGRDPLERVTGSLAFGAAARLVFATVKQRQLEGETGARFLLARVKSNIGPDGGGFEYEFEQREIEPHILANCIKWGNAISGDPRAMIADAEADPDDNEQDAMSFLRQYLGDGRKEVKDVMREGRAAGYSPDQLKRAKKNLQVKSEKDGMDGGWYWRLRDSEAPREGPDVPF